MPTGCGAIGEVDTVVVGAAYLVKGILDRLGVVKAIDAALAHQPEVGTTYGALAQVLITNRLTFDPVPLYELSRWAAQHGMDRVFHINAEWLDDDRMGAMLDGLADKQVTIWSAILQQACRRYGLDMEWLHADTTSVYFQGEYEQADGTPRPGRERVPMLVRGYNKDGQHRKVQLVLSLITAGRVPVHYRPWNGNQTDEGVYASDMSDLRQAVLGAGNSILVGDRKLCNYETMVTFCRQGQLFLGPHPWTETMKAHWLQTRERLAAGQLQWGTANYVSVREASKPAAERTQHRFRETTCPLLDKEKGAEYSLRYVFGWSSQKAEQDRNRREKAVLGAVGELGRLARLAGKYRCKTRQGIERRAEHILARTKTAPYIAWTLEGTEEGRDWRIAVRLRTEAAAAAAAFDGVVPYCTNAPTERLPAAEIAGGYKGQAGVEQTIDFIKSPVRIRPMWLHLPKRLAGLTLLVMIAVLIAALLEQQVRRWIVKTGSVVKGLMPEGRDNAHPTAAKLLRAFADYTVVLIRSGDGRAKAHYPSLRPVQQCVWDIMGLPAMADC